MQILGLLYNTAVSGGYADLAVRWAPSPGGFAWSISSIKCSAFLLPLGRSLEPKAQRMQTLDVKLLLERSVDEPMPSNLGFTLESS
jgi:hypothetical protein